jgi:hypothetical protein
MKTNIDELRKVLLTSDGKGVVEKEAALSELIAIFEHEAFDKGVDYANLVHEDLNKRIKNFKRERKVRAEMAW